MSTYVVSALLIIKEDRAKGVHDSAGLQRSKRHRSSALFARLGLKSTRHLETLLWAPFHALA